MFDLADDYNLLKFFNEKIYIGLPWSLVKSKC